MSPADPLIQYGTYEHRINTFKQSGIKPSPVKLAVYDFDSTLFRSPNPSEQFSTELQGRLTSGLGWFHETRLLSEECIGKIPWPQWWHTETVMSAVQDIASPNTLTIMLTGRRECLFAARVEELCRTCSLCPLPFDLFFLREDGFESTMIFKLSVIDSLLEHFPSITHVEVYEDRLPHCKRFQSHLSIKKLTVVHHVVQEDADVGVSPALELEIVHNLVTQYNADLANSKTIILMVINH